MKLLSMKTSLNSSQVPIKFALQPLKAYNIFGAFSTRNSEGYHQNFVGNEDFRPPKIN